MDETITETVTGLSENTFFSLSLSLQTGNYFETIEFKDETYIMK